VIAGPHFDNYKAGFGFGRLGYELVEERGLRRFQARTYVSFGNLVMPWTKHVKTARDLLRRAFEAANKIGDLTFAAYCRMDLNTNLLAAGDPLSEVQREAEHGLEFAHKMRFGLVIDRITAQLGLIRTLRGLTQKFGSFDDNQFDELRFEGHLFGNPALALPECWYWTRKLQARFFAGDYAAAVDASLRAQRLLWTSPSCFETAEYHFYGALSRAASCDSAAANHRQQHFEALTAHHGQLEVWAENCPENFENRASLVGAEIARVEGRELDAERLYEQAIRSARTNGFVHNEALAHELAARFYAARGFETIAQAYTRNAWHCYVRWEAAGKVRQLEGLYPHLREEAPVPAPASTIGAPVEHLDLATVIKVSQAISGEIVLNKLINKLMRIALEQAGAERGLLILARGNEQRIEAEASSDSDKVTVHFRRSLVAPSELPESLLRHVIRTQESVTLHDALTENLFSEDEYIQRKRPRSVFCLPLIKQRKLMGVLYLENNLAPGVFTPNRLATLELIASQAAISLEQARLYAEIRRTNEDLQTEISERRRAEEALKKSEQQLADILDHTTAVVSVKGLDLHYLLINREHERRFQVQRDQIRGKTDYDFLPRDIAEKIRSTDRQVIEAGRPIQYEVAIPTAESVRRYVVVKFLLRDGTGMPYAICGISTDITELKRAEELEAEMAHERAMFLEEKTRLAGEIHDSLAQSFTGISMQLGMAREVMTDNDNELLGYLERANDLARFGLAEARRSVLTLQPMIIKDAGLIESLQMLVERSNIPGRLRCTFRSNLEDDEILPVVVRQDLLRIAQEAISNALRHAKSTTISVKLRSDPPNLILKVTDNGCGITSEAETREGFGFANMRARVKKLEGTLDIRTAPGRGTNIVVCVPVNARS
jgi:PAS domain S-box-containing protein